MNLFLHIPRCGGISILHSLSEIGIRVYVADENTKHKVSYDLADMIFGHFLVKEQLKHYSNFKLVTIIRDPIDMIVSNYKQYKMKLKKNSKLREDVYYDKISFEDYALSSEIQNMITRQFLYGVKIEDIDYIGSFDDLEKSYNKILNIFNVKKILSKPLKKFNSSSLVADPFISDNLRDKLKIVNKDDYELYNFAVSKNNFLME